MAKTKFIDGINFRIDEERRNKIYRLQVHLGVRVEADMIRQAVDFTYEKHLEDMDKNVRKLVAPKKEKEV